MKLTCTTCGQDCQHLKALIDHYQENHPELLRRYHIKHPPSKTTVTMYAPDADSIIEAQGWRKEDCKVAEI